MKYSTPGHPDFDALDALVSRYVKANDMPWIDLPFDGVKGKILLMDERGVRTALAWMSPGSEIPHHEHTGLEQSYVIDGAFEDQDGECKAGEYVWRLAGNRHTARSPKGCLMLSMFESPNIYLSGSMEGLTMEEFMARKAREPAE